jgi:hypothetical protein
MPYLNVILSVIAGMMLLDGLRGDRIVLPIYRLVDLLLSLWFGLFLFYMDL